MPAAIFVDVLADLCHRPLRAAASCLSMPFAGPAAHQVAGGLVWFVGTCSRQPLLLRLVLRFVRPVVAAIGIVMAVLLQFRGGMGMTWPLFSQPGLPPCARSDASTRALQAAKQSFCNEQRMQLAKPLPGLVR